MRSSPSPTAPAGPGLEALDVPVIGLVAISAFEAVLGVSLSPLLRYRQETMRER